MGLIIVYMLVRRVKTCLSRMETLQAKLLKAGIGVHKWSRSSPVLKALNIKKIETTIDISSLDLGQSLLCNGSRARSFYINLMNMHACGKLNGNNDLVSIEFAKRVISTMFHF